MTGIQRTSVLLLPLRSFVALRKCSSVECETDLCLLFGEIVLVIPLLLSLLLWLLLLLVLVVLILGWLWCCCNESRYFDLICFVRCIYCSGETDVGVLPKITLSSSFNRSSTTWAESCIWSWGETNYYRLLLCEVDWHVGNKAQGVCKVVWFDYSMWRVAAPVTESLAAAFAISSSKSIRCKWYLSANICAMLVLPDCGGPINTVKHLGKFNAADVLLMNCVELSATLFWSLLFMLVFIVFT